MPSAIVKLVAMLLLVVQAAIGVAPGRMLCVPVHSHRMHESGADPGSSSDGSEVSDRSGCSGCSELVSVRLGFGVEAGRISRWSHLDEECACHVHVPIPDEEQLPISPRGDGPELRTVGVSATCAVVLIWDCDLPPVPTAILPPHDSSTAAQVLALKSTRLLI